jgi:predicted SAM-dependent methyltransferase
VEEKRVAGGLMKLVIGAASTRYDGWVMTDLPVLDALRAADWRRIFRRGSIDRILAEHVIEHWSADQFRLFLRLVRPFLSEQGFMRIAVPDGFHPDVAYINHVKPGGTGPGADDHKVLYDYVSMTRILSEQQYGFELLEYFDERHQFHRCPWDAGDGFIQRSVDHDDRNRERPLSYTSLILDTWPD